MSTPRISFVILTWNSERHVKSCVESVLGIGDLCLEVLVEDNGSTDGTLSLLREAAGLDARLRVEELGRNLGTTVPRNRALRRVSPDATHVCVLDSDTVVNRHAFEVMLEVLCGDASIGVVGPTMASSSGEEQLSGRNLPTLGIKLRKACPLGGVAARATIEEVPRTPVVGGLQDVGYLLSACWLVPRSSFNVVGLLDEEIFYSPEDVDWCLRCHEAGLRVVRAHGARIVHEYQRLTHRRPLSRMSFEHVRGLAHYFKKHGYLMRAPGFGTVGGAR